MISTMVGETRQTITEMREKMTLHDYCAYLTGTPFPNEQQVDAFTRHVATAHSWYKHLDLFRGARVVVFLDPRAGGGFDEQQPRLHYTWATRREYIERFGRLAYMWRHGGASDSEFSTDYELSAQLEGPDLGALEFVNVRETPMLALPAEIKKECSLRMYPFACDNGVILRRFEREIRAMEQGAIDHPCKELLIAALRASDHAHEIQHEISAANPLALEELLALKNESRKPDTIVFNERQRARMQAYDDVRTATARLADHEVNKIRRAVEALREHLRAARLRPV